MILITIFSCSYDNSFALHDEDEMEMNSESLSRLVYSWSDIASSCEKELQDPIDEVLWDLLQFEEYDYMANVIVMESGKRISWIFLYEDEYGSVGAYDPKFDEMYFRDVYVVPETFPEEFIHFIQDIEYHGWWNKANIEFEAKFLQDLINVGTGLTAYRGMGAEHGDSYIEWVVNLYYDYPHFYSEIMEGNDGLTYFDFLRDFSKANPQYGAYDASNPWLLELLYPY